MPSPLHLLAEHLWYLPLVDPDPWIDSKTENQQPMAESDIFKNMRATARNLIRRAEKEGVEAVASQDPQRDLPLFLALHNETRRRHHFTPYTDAFFCAQVAHFSKQRQCTLYLARYQGEVIAASIHMHVGGETSYHHGESTMKYRNITASYLLQWRAIQDALARGDHIYNFWGIAPPNASIHPFAGVTLFKTGFGGKSLELVHSMDLPLSKLYHLTRAFELLRKWRRGF
jgi:vancomycin resistance protein VanK